MSGYWEKSTGAAPIYIPDSSLRKPYAATSGFGNDVRNTTPLGWYTRSQRILNHRPYGHTVSMHNEIPNASRKRPSSAVFPQVPSKRQHLMSRLQSSGTIPTTKTSTQRDGNRLLHLSALNRSSNETSLRRENGVSNNKTLSVTSPFTMSATHYESNKRKQCLDKIFARIVLDKEDKQQSKRLVDRTLKSIIASFDRSHGGIYRRQYIDAGSYPVKLKINKADEFDVNIPLNIEVKRVRTSGKVTYIFKEQTSNLHVEKRLFFNPDGTAIPLGYAVVEVEMQTLKYNPISIVEIKNLPRKFLHTYIPFHGQQLSQSYTYNLMHFIRFANQPNRSNRSSTSKDCIELIPEDVKRGLFEKIRSVIFFQWPQVHICKVSHGPALKMTLVPIKGSGIKHNISVDIAASLHCDIPLSSFGWPRENTKRAFDSEVINEVIKAGVHLVPKKDLFWAISFSKAEKSLLSRLDKDGGCRKYVTKIMKKFVMTCSSQSENGLPGITSHIIKTRILWSCEEHGNEPSYWRYENRDICLINTLTELETNLTYRRLPDYFDERINVLDDKEVDLLDTLSSFIRNIQIELCIM